LCYDQIDTPKNDISNECRRLVLNKETLEVVSYPFYRFSDYTPKQHKLDFDKGLFYEKIAGSLCTLHFYDNKWNISTKDTPMGEDKVEKNNEQTFSEYFFKVLNKTTNLKALNTNFFYITEFKFPSGTHHLIPNTDSSINLIGLRDKKTLEELPHNMLNNDFNVLQGLKFKEGKELFDYINNLDPIVSEGLVYVNRDKVTNGNYQRFKIKPPQFELIFSLKTVVQSDITKERERKRLNTKWLKELCQYNKHRTFLELKKYSCFREEVENIDKKIKLFEDTCNQYFHITNPKETSLLNVEQEVKTWLFLQLKQKT
jgi:hypothetical protein